MTLNLRKSEVRASCRPSFLGASYISCSLSLIGGMAKMARSRLVLMAEKKRRRASSWVRQVMARSCFRGVGVGLFMVAGILEELL